MEHWLEDAIRVRIGGVVAEANTGTRYRTPLVAFVNAAHPDFQRLKSEIDPDHFLPGDLLPGARSVISFFVPFHRDVILDNAGSGIASRGWALAYIETNTLIGDICATLGRLLHGHGYDATWELPTHNFDPVRLVSRWSHKSIAVIAGLGSFGLHQMVITDAGCAGRFGSVVTSADLEPSGLPARQRCRYVTDGGCKGCVKRCPVGALREDSFDRQRCYDRCLEVDRYYSDLGLTDVCGKCATGPCALAPYQAHSDR